MSKKYVFDFTEGGNGDVALLGIKGGNLAAMTQMGLPVPVGFNITTECCVKFLHDGNALNTEMTDQILRAISRIEKEVGLKFGDEDNPLLFSVRTGASVKMKGLSATVLNIGLNDEIVSKIVRSTKNPVFAWELYCRFIRDFAICTGLDSTEFREVENKIRIEEAGTPEPELLQKIISQFKRLYKKLTKESFPQDVRVQLMTVIACALMSWNSETAKIYRRVNNIDDNLGCALSVQAMVYGNYDMESGVGVAHTRNIITGQNEVTGEYVRRSQDKNLLKSKVTYDMAELKKENKAVYLVIENACKKLERYFQDVMSIEFCVQSSKVFIMQVEKAKRTPQASVKTAVEMAGSRVFGKKQALLQVEPSSVRTLLQPSFDGDRTACARVLGEGICSYPGCASGVIALSAAMALQYASEGKNVIFVRESTSAQDAEGFEVASGVITTTGGSQSHASVVARAKALPCIVNCKRISINENTHAIKLGGMNYHEGDMISIDAEKGVVYGEVIALKENGLTGDLGTLIEWAKPLASIPIYADASTAVHANRALSLGAEGIGLVRTENMFYKSDRLPLMRKFLLATDEKMQESALKSMLRAQTVDFVSLFETMGTREVNVRLMDPPMHKFLPTSQNTLRAMARELGVSYDDIRDSVDALIQENPMMGIRGCRLLIMFPELIEMQVTAVINALLEVRKKTRKMPQISFIVPLVTMVPEFEAVERGIRRAVEAQKDKIKFDFDYKIGCMIETPRSCLIADKIAQVADFVCFGCNDLTQLTLGFSRDDCTKFLRDYYADNLMYSDPFVNIDKNGVFELMSIAVAKIREVKPKMPIWMFGEHSSDAASIKLAMQLNIDKISCVPSKVPSVVLAQAQAKCDD